MTFGRVPILAAGLAALAALGAASDARADFFSELDIRIDVGRPTPERVWVEPVYETQCVPVVHEAVYDERRVPVWVPDRFEVRRERYRDECGRPVVRDVRYVCEPGHYETQYARVIVREAYTETIERRVVVREGRWVDACESERSQVRIDVDGRRDDRRREWDRGDRDRHDPRRDDDRRGDRGGHYSRR